LSDTDGELFGSIVLFTQELMVRMDQLLEPFGLTSRQWSLIAAIAKRFPEGYAPTISEAATAFGTSRQNVKQVAAQLERRGWLRLQPDPADRRATRLVLTEQRDVFDDSAVQGPQAAFVRSLFGELTPRERQVLLTLVSKCMNRLSPRREGPPDELGHPQTMSFQGVMS
jgi:DNA-binding MarR family transcriptional regulator